MFYNPEYNIMKYIYYAKIFMEKIGFTNQLFSLITAIITAHKAGKKVVIVDKFLNDYLSDSFSNISTILDIPKLNVYLKNKYDIIIVDRYNVNFKIVSVSYGSETNKIDITDHIIPICYTHNRLHISSQINLNKLKLDPHPGQSKGLHIKFFMNDYIFEESHQEWCEYLLGDIVFDLSDDNFLYRFEWINYLDRDMFDNILKNIAYNKYFLELKDNFINEMKLNTNDKINVIHLRVEHDAIIHWAKKNKMSDTDFKEYIENKYIKIIEDHVDKNDMNIILSYCTQNKVIDYLELNNYKYSFINKKLYLGREINAMIDLLISENCNNIFIGNFNMKRLNGSTFSYFISQKINNVKMIFVDLDNIQDDVEIC
jgi:hypothetical protein